MGGGIMEERVWSDIGMMGSMGGISLWGWRVGISSGAGAG